MNSRIHKHEMTDLKDNIKKWVKYDNELVSLRRRIAEIENKKKRYETSIIKEMDRNNMTDHVINIGDSKIKYDNFRRPEYLSKKGIEEKLGKYLRDESLAKSATEFIYKDRSVVIVPKLKRF